jgi:hypothetical protein
MWMLIGCILIMPPLSSPVVLLLRMGGRSSTSASSGVGLRANPHRLHINMCHLIW